MRNYQRYLLIVMLFMIGGLVTPESGARAQSDSDLKLDATRVAWTQLTFHAKNFWVDVSTNIQIQSLRASDLDTALLPSPRGRPIAPLSESAAQMTINTTIDPRFRSPVNIHNRIWFNPPDASALGRIRLRRGEDDFKKIYRFTGQGVFRHRMEPKNRKEASLTPEKWSDVKDSFYPYDLTRLGCAGVTERSLLIYILSAADFSKIDTPISLCVFGKRQLHRVQLQNLGLHPITADYVVKNQHSAIRKGTTIKALKIEITSKPIRSDLKASENFSFMGFHKDISIYIDPASRLPVQASGKIPTVGRTDLKLQQCQTKQ